ncbi:MAG: FAD-dependent thymidylate synthase [Candidatus Kerfeldbacteria bacterium]|nr:FAD-dependent thymidylate synthase [Candidatus Kerfeldbacteria bacterium]
MIAKPEVNLEGLRDFLKGFDPELKFIDYVDDPTMIPAGTQLTKIAGQQCYFAFGSGRSWNEDAARYIRNILEQKHGSVLEHANYSFHLYGISRSLTHELVRHRAGLAFSQTSQRYVDGKILRFVMRPEFQDDSELEAMFFADIDSAANKYERRAELLMERQQRGQGILTGEKKRDLRKKVNQAARSILPNETEAPTVVTANVRAWRHMLNMRASEHAETEIRRLFVRIFACLLHVDPILFGDFQVVAKPDGIPAIETPFVKV